MGLISCPAVVSVLRLRYDGISRTYGFPPTAKDPVPILFGPGLSSQQTVRVHLSSETSRVGIERAFLGGIAWHCVRFERVAWRSLPPGPVMGVEAPARWATGLGGRFGHAALIGLITLPPPPPPLTHPRTAPPHRNTWDYVMPAASQMHIRRLSHRITCSLRTPHTRHVRDAQGEAMVPGDHAVAAERFTPADDSGVMFIKLADGRGWVPIYLMCIMSGAEGGDPREDTPT